VAEFSAAVELSIIKTVYENIYSSKCLIHLASCVTAIYMYYACTQLGLAVRVELDTESGLRLWVRSGLWVVLALV